jgi:hypothetical protein
MRQHLQDGRGDASISSTEQAGVSAKRLFSLSRSVFTGPFCFGATVVEL